MDFEHSAKVKELQDRLWQFMNTHILPNEEKLEAEINEGERFKVLPSMEELKAKAKGEGLWNMFLPDSERGFGLTNLEYAPLCEIMGWSPFAPEAFNCSAPDTGNMEILERFASDTVKKQWLEPLLAGEIRSAFAMTEPAVASSDATNIEAHIRREGDEYVINGRKWWISGVGDPRCKVLIFMGKTAPDIDDRHRQQSMIVVPADAPGVKVERLLSVFGFDSAPHGHGQISFSDVRVPVDNILLGEGRGFEIAQARLGPGRIHHCMRSIGVAERTLEQMCKRTRARHTFGKYVSEQTVTQERIAEARIMIDQARLLVLQTAYKMDTIGNKDARKDIAMIKVAVPNMACKIIDWAIQAYGGAGVNTDPGLAAAYAHQRTLRLADGPDEVHRNQIARLELRRYN